MPSALIVSAGEKGQAVLRDMLSASRFDRVTTVSNGSDARRALISQGYELVVINTPLTDEFGHELAAHASAGGAGVIMLCKAEHAEQLGAALEREGVFVMSKPLVRPLFMQALHLVEMTQARMYELIVERDKLRRQLEDLRAVSRAKCLLIERLGWTEEKAHRHIEKQAMDLRISKREVAEEILKTYSV